MICAACLPITYAAAPACVRRQVTYCLPVLAGAAPLVHHGECRPLAAVTTAEMHHRRLSDGRRCLVRGRGGWQQGNRQGGQGALLSQQACRATHLCSLALPALLLVQARGEGHALQSHRALARAPPRGPSLPAALTPPSLSRPSGSGSGRRSAAWTRCGAWRACRRLAGRVPARCLAPVRPPCPAHVSGCWVGKGGPCPAQLDLQAVRLCSWMHDARSPAGVRHR